jgi:hypothetical protein
MERNVHLRADVLVSYHYNNKTERIGLVHGGYGVFCLFLRFRYLI